MTKRLAAFGSFILLCCAPYRMPHAGTLILDYNCDPPATPVTPTTVSGDLLEWADLVFVMDNDHLSRLKKRFRPALKGKKVVVLGVPDEFEFMDPRLVSLLERRVLPHLRRRG